jgi:enoyl-[acyl-carrier protein] reductase I
VPLLVKISDVRFRNPVYPGDTVTIEVKKKDMMGGFFLMSGSMKRGETRDPERRVLGRLEDAGGRHELPWPRGKDLPRVRRRQQAERRLGVGRSLEEEGAHGVYSVRSDERRKSLDGAARQAAVHVCDVEERGRPRPPGLGGRPPRANRADPGHRPFDRLRQLLRGLKPFHATKRKDFLQAAAVSAFSLVEIARAFKPLLARDASVVTIGISSLLVTPDNYGYMGPIKAALESSARFLAKSFSADSEVRFNVVGSGPPKTSASAGIPGYLESYLFAEKLTFRKRNLETQEVANAALFLLSARSSGINGSTLGRGRRAREQHVRQGRHPARDEAGALRGADGPCASPTSAWSRSRYRSRGDLDLPSIEERLRPLYERLKLPFGRLELMTGIRERRMWPDGTQPSDASAAAGRAVLGSTGLRREDIGLFIHAAVSRDMLEPASASFAHRKIGLPASAQIFDVSNACLGLPERLRHRGLDDRERPDPSAP